MDAPKPVLGRTAEAGWLNKLLNFVKSSQILPGRGYKINRKLNGTTLEIEEAKGKASSSISQYVIKSVEGDSITCRTVSIDTNGVRTEGADDELVAKNWELRNSITSETIDGGVILYTYPPAGNYVKRVADDGSATENQVVVPRYLVDSIIYVATVDGTGVYQIDDLTLEETEIKLLDINADGRAWTQENA